MNQPLPGPTILHGDQVQIINDHSVVFSARRPGIDLPGLLNGWSTRVHIVLHDLREALGDLSARVSRLESRPSRATTHEIAGTRQRVVKLDFATHRVHEIRLRGGTPVSIEWEGGVDGASHHVVLTRPANVVTLSWPNGVLWKEGSAPTGTPGADEALVVTLLKLGDRWLGDHHVARVAAPSPAAPKV